MKIVSSFSDYYDIKDSSGSVWHREEQTELFYSPSSIELLTGNRPSNPKAYPFPVCLAAAKQTRSTLFEFQTAIVGFCGKIYPCVLPHNGEKTFACYSIDDLDEFVAENIKESQKFMYYPTRRQKRKDLSARLAFDRFFDDCIERESDYEDIFSKNNCPVFVAQKQQGYRIVYNSRLWPFKFFLMFGPKETFDCISAYLSNVLGGLM